MRSFSSLTRVLRMFALSVFMLNVLSVSVLAMGVDSDLDGLADEDEAALSMDSALPDTDSDGTLDGDEDNDGDTLTNAQELYVYFTSATMTDTDGDSRDDNEEVSVGTNPAVSEIADLDITDISMDPLTGVISYTAANLGDVDVDYSLENGSTSVYINYGEGDQTFYGYQWQIEIPLGTFAGTFLNAGSSETVDTGLGLISGEHSVMVCVERAAHYGEMAAGFDNCEIETFTVGPDLTVTDVSIVETSTPGEFYVYTDLANTGDIDADATLPGSITTTLNGVTEQVYNWSSIDPIYQTFLPANGTTLDFESFGARPALVDGDVFEVCVDSGDLVTELDESNNCMTVTYSDGLDPDLVVDSVTLNEDTSVSFVVRNGGTEEVDSALFPYLNFYFDFYNSDLSTSSSVSYLIDDHGTDYRAVEGVTTVNSGPSGDAFPTCTMYVKAVADGTGEVTELSDYNNEYLTTLDLCPEALTVEAGVDEGIGIGTIYNLAAYAEGAASLTSATVDWGDGSALETVTQTLDGDRINLGATHLYDHRETFTITVCATDGIETVCDTLHLSITGSSSSSSSSSSGSSSSSSTDTSTDSGSSSTDEDVDLAGEEDQDVTLTEDDEVVDCTEMAFEDVAEGDELYDAICELWGTDVIHGKTANFFDFEDVIRRDEAAKIFTRWFGYVTEAYGDTPAAEGTFSDVEATDSLAYYVEVADGEGLVTGNTDSMEVDGEVVSESTFNPHDAITAQEIADALKEILGDNTAGEQLDEDGYVSEDSMTRGSFVELLYGLSR